VHLQVRKFQHLNGDLYDTLNSSRTMFSPTFGEMNQYEFSLKYQSIGCNFSNIHSNNYVGYWLIKFNLVQDDVRFILKNGNEIIYSKIFSHHVLKFSSKNDRHLLVKIGKLRVKGNLVSKIENVSNRMLNDFQISFFSLVPSKFSQEYEKQFQFLK
jgi:hypothetical protein